MFLKRCFHWLRYHPSCMLCGDFSNSDQPICELCRCDLPWLYRSCHLCAHPVPLEGVICPSCQQRAPRFNRVAASWNYQFPIDRLINRFKHQGSMTYGRLLSDMLSDTLEQRFQQGWARPHCLVPVPLSRQRERQRGFNQSQMLAGWLGRSLGIPVRPDLLRRVRDTPAQQKLNAKARRSNLKNAFTLGTASCLQFMHVAVVDDVLTTGATAECLADLLLRAGVRRVDVYCLARTQKGI